MKRRSFLKGFVALGGISLVPKFLKSAPALNSSEKILKFSDVFCRRRGNNNVYYLKKSALKTQFYKDIYAKNIKVSDGSGTYLPLRESLPLAIKKDYTESELKYFLYQVMQKSEKPGEGFMSGGKRPEIISFTKNIYSDKNEFEATLKIRHEFRDKPYAPKEYAKWFLKELKA